MDHGGSRPIRSSEIRRANEKTILRMLHEKGHLSQSDIAEHAGLQPSTVFRIFTSLEERNLIRPVEHAGQREERRGRKPSYYGLEPSARIFVGAELSGTGTSVSVVDFNGRTIHHETHLGRTDIDGNRALSDLIEILHRGISASRARTDRIVGIGIGVPGVVDTVTGTILDYERFQGMNGLRIGDLVSEELGIPSVVHNNASVIALAEYRFGNVSGTHSAVAFLLRAGMGGAYVVDGRIVESHGRSIFEVGHLLTDLNTSRSDSARDPVVLEEFLGERAIRRCVAEADGTSTDWPSIIRRLEAGDEELRGLLRPSADLLAGVARNVSLLLSPESFLIITRFHALSRFFADSIERRFRGVSDPVRLGVRRIVPVAYDSRIAAGGAAELVFEHYFADTQADS